MTDNAIARRLSNGRRYEPAPWPAPDLSVLSTSRSRPMPLPIEHFGLWKNWLETAAVGTSTLPDYVACALLAIAGALIGNARWVSPWPDWSEPPVLWLCLIGSPSSGKSPALAPLRRILGGLETELAARHADELLRWEAQKAAAEIRSARWHDEVKDAVRLSTPPPDMPADAVMPSKPPRPRLCVSDTTQEAIGEVLAGQPKGVLMFRDELAAFLASFDRYSGKSGGDRAFWLECLGGRPHTIDRVKNGGKPHIIPHLSVGILGGIQPDRLTSLLFSGDDDGLAARFLMCWPDSIRPARPTTTTDLELAISALRRLVELDLPEAGPAILPLTEPATTVFDAWRGRSYDACQHETGLMAGHLGKLPGFALRLALVLEHLWWCIGPHPSPPQHVSDKALQSAISLIDDYFLPMALLAYGNAALPQAERDAAQLARWLKKERPPLVNARVLHRTARLPGLSSAAAMHAAIEILLDANILRRPLEEGPTNGRPRADYEVNPLLWNTP